MSEAARDFLRKMLERAERGGNTYRRPAGADIPPGQEEDFFVELKRFEADKLIAIKGQRQDAVNGVIGTVHLLERERLGRHLGYVPFRTRVAAQFAALEAVGSNNFGWIAEAAAEIHDRWLVQRPAFGLAADDDPSRIEIVFKLLAAIGRREHEGMDWRSFSIKVTGNSKALEEVQGPVGNILRWAFGLSDDEDTFAEIGLVRFRGPVLFASPGPVEIPGHGAIHMAPYIGVPVEQIAAIRFSNLPQYILTVENFTSFQRQIREAFGNDGLVLYVGGFPGAAELDLLRRCKLLYPKVPFFHWGDIDPGGLSIFRMLEVALPDLQPHLMTPDLAMNSSNPVQPDRRLIAIADSNSAVASLASWLRSESGRTLEQEALRPQKPDIR